MWKFVQFFSFGQKYDFNKMAEIEKEAVEFPVTCELAARDIYIPWKHINFFFIIYIVQLYIRILNNLADILGCSRPHQYRTNS